MPPLIQVVDLQTTEIPSRTDAIPRHYHLLNNIESDCFMLLLSIYFLKQSSESSQRKENTTDVSKKDTAINTKESQLTAEISRQSKCHHDERGRNVQELVSEDSAFRQYRAEFMTISLKATATTPN